MGSSKGGGSYNDSGSGMGASRETGGTGGGGAASSGTGAESMTEEEHEATLRELKARYEMYLSRMWDAPLFTTERADYERLANEALKAMNDHTSWWDRTIGNGTGDAFAEFNQTVGTYVLEAFGMGALADGINAGVDAGQEMINRDSFKRQFGAKALKAFDTFASLIRKIGWAPLVNVLAQFAQQATPAMMSKMRSTLPTVLGWLHKLDPTLWDLPDALGLTGADQAAQVERSMKDVSESAGRYTNSQTGTSVDAPDEADQAAAGFAALAEAMQ